MNIPLINRYRPENFEEIVGHDEIKAALKRVLTTDSQPHSYLLTGPGGIGKTTIARIIGRSLGCDIVEISAAENSGTDDMRRVIDLGNHMSLTGSGLRMIIIDECHGLSKPAWQVLLKLVEEPPEHLFLALCTTELAKVPDTIIQRCFHVPLKPLSVVNIEEILLTICNVEEWEVQPDVLTLVLQAAQGSPRRAISTLQAVWDAPSLAEASRIIQLQDGSEPLVEMCKYITNNVEALSWAKFKGFLDRIEDGEWDNASLLIGRFIVGAMLRTSEQEKAGALWRILDALTFPIETHDRKVAFYAAIGKIIWGNS
jgi:DNA polymerase III gamma/tau subunit